MRYIRLYAYFLQFSFSKAMQFRLDFCFRIMMDCLFYLIQFLFFNVLYLHTNTLAGWDMDQMSIFIAGYIFIDALHMTVFSTNCWWFPIYINRGDLDYYLTKPISTLFFLSVREFAANSFVNLIIASVLLATMISNYPGEFSSFKIIGFVVLLVFGTLMYFFMHLIFLLSVFWSGSPRGFSDVFFAASHVMERPLKIFKGPVRFTFLYILPFGVMASYPASFLLEEATWEIVLTVVGMTFALFCTSLFIWNRGLKVYSSASS